MLEQVITLIVILISIFTWCYALVDIHGFKKGMVYAVLAPISILLTFFGVFVIIVSIGNIFLHTRSISEIIF